MADERAKIHVKNYEWNLIERNEMLPYWGDIGNLIRPARIGRRGLTTGGLIDKRYDSTASEAQMILAFAMQAGMIPKSLLWLLYRIPSSDPSASLNSNQRVAQWMQSFSEVVWLMLNRSNYYKTAGEIFRDATSFHTASSYSEENTLAPGFQNMAFHSLGIGSYVFSENKYHRPDQMYEPYLYTARQAKQDFVDAEEKSIDILPKAIREELGERGNPDKTFEFLRYVGPRKDGIKGSRFNKEMPFEALDIYLGAKSRLIRGIPLGGRQDATIVRESGHNEFPYTVWRWATNSGEKWGSGQSDIALPTIKLINRTKMKSAKALDQEVDPPYLLDATHWASKPRFNSGSLNWVNKIEGAASALRYEGRRDFAALDVENMRTQIREIYFRDFMILPGKTMTAEEVITLRNQLERFLGPNVESGEFDHIAPTVERAASIAIRSGLAPEPPPELDRVRSIEPEFLGTLAKAQKRNDIESIERFLGTTANIMNVFPESGDNVDIDEVIRILGTKHGIPDKILRDVDAVDAIREAKREAFEQQKAQESALNITKAIGQGANAEKLLSQAGVVA